MFAKQGVGEKLGLRSEIREDQSRREVGSVGVEHNEGSVVV